MEKQRTKPRTITMYPQDWKDIEQVAQDSGVKTLSAAMRIILQEWRLSRVVKPLEVEHVTAAN